MDIFLLPLTEAEATCRRSGSARNNWTYCHIVLAMVWPPGIPSDFHCLSDASKNCKTSERSGHRELTPQTFSNNSCPSKMQHSRILLLTPSRLGGRRKVFLNATISTFPNKTRRCDWEYLIIRGGGLISRGEELKGNGMDPHRLFALSASGRPT